MFEPTIRDDVCRCRRPDSRWLVTGWDGGYHDAEALYNVSVSEGFDRTDLASVRDEHLTAADFDDDGPAFLTGVSMDHARCASAGSVTVLATVGLSNPAALPMESDTRDDGGVVGENGWRPGTVNLVVGTERALDDGTLAELLATCVEAKAATLSALVGFPGTTSDAVAVGCVPDGEPADFAGSATEVGSATRACVRDTIRASFASRYADTRPPASVEDADYGVVTDRHTDVFRP